MNIIGFLMFKNKRFLSIIPARAGSKRLPKKNVKDLAGKPLISWSIESSIDSKYIDATLVTSDCDEVLSIANTYDIQAITRPSKLSTDTAKTLDVVFHAIEHIEENFDYIVLLQPTSPLRTSIHIDEAIELLISKNANAVISVGEMEHSPLWSNTLNETNSMEGFFDENVYKRSQELPTYYRLNGAIYICDISELIKTRTYFLENNIFAYKMSRESSVDIDDEIDFKFAELLFDK